MAQRVLGLDIGGANLKAATASGETVHQPFPLWREPQNLATALRGVIEQFAEVDQFAVTMTGELCDCFRSKREGVKHILQTMESVAGSREVWVWSTEGRFVDVPTAIEDPLRVAAANWHALATWVGQWVGWLVGGREGGSVGWCVGG